MIDVALPADGQVLPAGQLWLVGTATDNVKVTGATAAVQRASDKKWLTSRGGWTRSRNDLEAAIAFDASGTASWYLSATLKVGSYAVAATAIDAAGNASEAAGPIGFRVQ